MAKRRETETLVVGAGPVGMVAALALAEHGVPVEIVDEEWRPTARSYALALHPRTLSALDGLGLGAELAERGRRVDRLAFYGPDDLRSAVDFGALEGDHPYLLILPQKALEDVLEERLERHGVRVRWNHRLAGLEADGDGGPVATVEQLEKESSGYSVATTVWVVKRTTEHATRFVLGADGHRSRVRRALGLEFPVRGPEELYAVFEFDARGGVQDEVRVVFDQGNAAVLWPLEAAGGAGGVGRQRWSFEVETSTIDVERPDKSRLAVQVGREAYPYLSRTDLETLIEYRAPWYDAEIGEVAWSVAVRFERRLVESFGRGGVWLAGDAAHVGLPIGVHSMNLGLIEALGWAERVAAAVRGKGSGEDLEAFGRERRGEWERLVAPEVRPRKDAEEWVAESAERIVTCIPASGEDLTRLAGQLGLEVR